MVACSVQPHGIFNTSSPIVPPCTGLVGGWDQEDGFEEVPLDHPAVPALKPAGNSSKRIAGGGSGGNGEAERLRKQVSELQAGLEAAEAVSQMQCV